MKDEIIDGRLVDIPYRTSPPILFVYEQTANLIAGTYDFPDGSKNTFTPSRPILANSLYIFNTLDFAADIAEIDYQSARNAAPQFSMYVQSDAGGPALREPIPLVKYFTVMPYILNILGTEMLGQAYPGSAAVSPTQNFFNNRLMGSIVGNLTQVPALQGKTSITLTLVFTAQEITDRNFLQDFNDRSEVGSRPR